MTGNIPGNASMRLAELHLAHGSHETPLQGACLLEAASWYGGGVHTDSPRRVSPVLARAGRRVNDLAASPALRQILLPLVPLLVGTGPASPATEEARILCVLDGVFRQMVPLALRLRGGLEAHADAFESLPEISSPEAALAGSALLASLPVLTHDPFEFMPTGRLMGPLALTLDYFMMIPPVAFTGPGPTVWHRTLWDIDIFDDPEVEWHPHALPVFVEIMSRACNIGRVAAVEIHDVFTPPYGAIWSPSCQRTAPMPRVRVRPSV